MKAVCFRETETVEVQQVDEPVIESADDVIVKVQCAGLCGSDLHLFHGRESGADAGTIMGHEFVGEVVEIGRDVRTFRVGDRICSPFTTNCGDCYFCRTGLTSRCVHGQLFGWRTGGRGLHGGQAEFVRVPLADSTLLNIPDGVSNELAILLGDNLSTGFYCAELAGIRNASDAGPDDTVAVIGCGTVGLLSIFAARYLGADKIFAFDLLPERLKIAKSFGAVTCDNAEEFASAIEDATDGRGADRVMELVGLPAAQQLAIRILRSGGTMAVVGCHCTPDFAFSPTDAYDKNLTFRTGRCPAGHYMRQLAGRINEDQFKQCESLITHKFSIDQGVEAYNVFSNRKDGCLKAMLQFN